jgi:hypothetical protein
MTPRSQVAGCTPARISYTSQLPDYITATNDHQQATTGPGSGGSRRRASDAVALGSVHSYVFPTKLLFLTSGFPVCRFVVACFNTPLPPERFPADTDDDVFGSITCARFVGHRDRDFTVECRLIVNDLNYRLTVGWQRGERTAVNSGRWEWGGGDD